MKIICIGVLMVFFATNIQAQKLTKEEKAVEKEYAKKLKELTPMQFKELVEKHQQLQQKVKTIDAQMQEVRTEIATKDGEISMLKAANEKLEQEKIAYEATIPEKVTPKKNAKAGAKGGTDTTDVSNAAFSAVVGAGADRQVLAQFENRQDADTFRANLQKIGVSGVSIIVGKK